MVVRQHNLFAGRIVHRWGPCLTEALWSYQQHEDVTQGSFRHQGAHTLQKSARGGVFLRCKCVTHHLGTGQQWARGGVFLRKCKCVTHHLHIGQKWVRVRRCKCLTHHLGTGQKWAKGGIFLRRCMCVKHQ